MEHKKGPERTIAATVAAAIGGVVRHHHEHGKRPPRPEILNDERLDADKRLCLNDVAVVIMCAHQPNRTTIMRELGISKDWASHMIGYLKDNGLITRVGPGKAPPFVPAHYVPTVTMLDVVRDPETYTVFHEALAHRTERMSNGSS